MAMEGIVQPEQIPIHDRLRLRKYDGNIAFALEWYQDEETVMLVDGVSEPYDMARLQCMYSWLDDHGELYFIEFRQNDEFIPIGDVTLCKNDLPIVIGDRRFRHCGIGQQVVKALIQRGKALSFPQLFVREIYSYNTGSQRLFESLGFVPYEATEKGHRYRLDLSTI